MQAKHFRWVFLPIVCLFLFGIFRSPQVSIGVSAEWSNGQYRFSGGTEPWALMLAGGIIAFYLLLLYSPPTALGGPIPGLFRRFVAFWIDFMVGMLGIAPIAGLLPTFLEWRRTGDFQWTFERDTATNYDAWTTAVLIVVASAWLILYFAWPLVRRVPSPGASVMGYQIVADQEVKIAWRKAILRTFFGFIATCAFYTAFISHDKERGKFWLDKRFSTHAESIV